MAPFSNIAIGRHCDWFYGIRHVQMIALELSRQTPPSFALRGRKIERLNEHHQQWRECEAVVRYTLVLHFHTGTGRAEIDRMRTVVGIMIV